MNANGVEIHGEASGHGLWSTTVVVTGPDFVLRITPPVRGITAQELAGVLWGCQFELEKPEATA